MGAQGLSPVADQPNDGSSASSPLQAVDPTLQIQILLAHSHRFASVFNYDWNLIEQSEEALQRQEAARKDAVDATNTANNTESAKLHTALEQRNHTIYRHRASEESYMQQALAMAAHAPAQIVLEPNNIKDGNRFDHLIFNHENKPYYVKYTELKAAFSINLELDHYKANKNRLSSPATPRQELQDIDVQTPEDAYLQAIHKAQAEKLAQYPLETEEEFKKRAQHYVTYDHFLAHLQQHKSSVLGKDDNAIISYLYICYLRRKRKLEEEKKALEEKLGISRKNRWTIVKNAAAERRLTQKADSDSEDKQESNDGSTTRYASQRLSSVVQHWRGSTAIAGENAEKDRLAIIDSQLENYADYESFLMFLEQSKELENDDEYAAYGQFIEEEIKKLNIKHYGWGNKADYIRVLRPNNRIAFIDAAKNSAPGVSLLTVIAKLVEEENVTLSFGIAANVLLIPLFFWSFHESVEIAKYQNEHHGTTPDSDNPILHKIKKDSMAIAGQSFAAAILGTLIMNRELQNQMGFYPIEWLINGISPGSLVPGALTGETRAAALQALPGWVNFTAILVCGALVGTLIAGITAASTWKDEEFSWAHVGKSFGLGFAAGAMMYTSCLWNLSNDKMMSDFFGLVINGLLGLGLHLTVPKNRYQTTEQKHAAAEKEAANEGTDLLSCFSKCPWMSSKKLKTSMLAMDSDENSLQKNDAIPNVNMV